MKKYYIFKMDQRLEKNKFISVCNSYYKSTLSCFFTDTLSGYIVADIELFDAMPSILKGINLNYNINITVCCMHLYSDFSEMAILKAIEYKRNTCVHLADLTLDCIFNKDEQYIQTLPTLFSKLNIDLLHTGYEYVNSGLNAMHASKKLYIHRNTFSYRLKKIEQLIQLNMKDFHNAHLLYYYVKYNNIGIDNSYK